MAGILRTDTIQNSNTSTIITQTNSTTITIGTTGQTVALASGATSSGFGATYNGAVNWDTTKKTTGFTAVNGSGYFCDTSSAAFTVTLPATPSAGDIVAFSDYTGTWQTNSITLGRNGSNINGAAGNLVLNVSNSTATLIYVDATEGWRLIDTGSLSAVNAARYVAATGGTITTCGNYKIHTFTGPGTFTVTCAGNSEGSNSVDYLVIAGGGGAGGKSGWGMGGGGAGGYRESVPSPAAWTASPLANPGGALPVSATAYPITVGSGGAGSSLSGCTCASDNASGTSSIFSTITSAGGGKGGNTFATPARFGSSGGSGGGGSACGPGTPGNAPGSAGNTPPVSPPQGNNGGNGGDGTTAFTAGGGGGGAGAVGSNASPIGTPSASSFGGNGGNGVATSITGTPVTRGGGGAGSTNGSGSAVSGTGGTGGGGDGYSFNGAGGPSVANGTANTGGGGGAGGGPGNTGIRASGTGGSGIVVIRYKFQ